MNEQTNVTDLTKRDRSRRRRQGVLRHPVGMKLREDVRFAVTPAGLDALERIHAAEQRAADVRREVYGNGAWE